MVFRFTKAPAPWGAGAAYVLCQQQLSLQPQTGPQLLLQLQLQLQPQLFPPQQQQLLFPPPQQQHPPQLLLFPQLHPQMFPPQPQLLPPPQQQHRMMRMMIQQQLPPKPLLFHIKFTSCEMWGRSRASVHHMQEAAGGARRAAFFIPSGNCGVVKCVCKPEVGKMDILKIN